MSIQKQTPITAANATRSATLERGYSGKLGGISNANKLCTIYAQHANVGGVWKAFLSARSPKQDAKDLVKGDNAKKPVTNNKSYVFAQAVTLTADVTVTAFGLKLKSNPQIGLKVIMALYTDDSDKPKTKLFESQVTTLTATTNTIPLTTQQAVKAGKYWLVYKYTGGSSSYITTQSGGSRNLKVRYKQTTKADTSLPAAWYTSGTSSQTYYRTAHWLIGF